MLGTPLVGATTATVAEGVATLADVALVGAATTATWSVAAGATRVPVSTPLVLTATAPIAAVDVSATTVRVQTGGVDVDVRRTLSSTGRTLTLVPVAALRAGTTYTLTVAGLRDTYGQLVVVAPVPFTTAADTPLVLDPQGLVLGMPDAQGRVLVTAAAGALSAAATVLVVNTGNGQVSSFTVGNDGSLSGEIVASIQDRLLVTVADPTGRHVTIERSQYVAADGTTAVGVAGGTVVGTGGTAIRIPAAALAQAAVWKVTGLAVEDLPAGPAPDLPGLTLASGMRIETTGVTRLATEAKLVFPKPAAAPEGATYVVVRRLQGPEGRVAYETLDYASVEGTGADARVVTASAPFAGYISSINGYAAMGLDVGGGASGQLTNYALLMWAFDQAMPGRPMGGTITGKVVRTVWAAGAAAPTYEPVVGALVSGVDAQGEPLWTLAPGAEGPNVAVSQDGGTYALWDWAFAGGAVTVSATVGGQTQTATAYEVAAPDLTRSPGLRFTRTVAHATVVFPPAAPTTPTPLLGVSVLAETASGLAETNGLVTVGTPLRVRVRDDRAAAAQATSDLTVQGVTIGGEARSASRQADGTVLSDAPWTPTQVGAVTVTATALAPGGGVLTASVTLRVLAAGGSVNEPLPNDPPAVITALTLPKAGATGVPVTVYPQVTFTEPVTHVVGGVTLEQLAAEGDTVVATVPVTLLGVGPAGPVALDVNNAPIAAVTSLTIQPTVGLAYATRYRLRLGAPIVDTDTDVATGAPAPKALTAYATTFTTFGPEAIGQTATTFVSPGIVLIDTRGYVATPEVSGLGSTQLRVYDVSDPVTPTEVVQETPRSYVGTPTVLVGEAVSALTGGPLVALGTARTQIPWGPSNLLLFDVQTDVPQWIGAVSVGRSPTDGILQQVVLRGTRAYAATVGLHKGLQVIDLAVARDLWTARLGGWLEGNPAYWSTLGELNTEGTGFGQGAIVQTVTVPTGTGDLSHLYALDVWDGVVDGQAQPLVVATGRTPLAVVNPQTGEILHNGPIPWADGATPAVTAWGAAIVVTHVADRDVAVLVTTAMPTARLVVVDLSDPAAPQVLSELALTDPTVGWKSGLLIKDGIVCLGGATNTTLVNLTDPLQPRLAGTITGVGGRLALSADGLLFGTSHPFGAGAATPEGIKTAVLDHAVPLLAVTPGYALVVGGKTVEPLRFRYQIVPDAGAVTSARLEVRDEHGTVLYASPVPIQDRGEVEWPAGVSTQATPRRLRLRVRNADGTVSEPVAAQGGLMVQPPEVRELVPTSLEASRVPQDLRVRGWNFGPACTVRVTNVDGTGTTQGATYVGVRDGLQELLVRLDREWLSAPGAFQLEVIAGALASEPAAVPVVPVGTPPPPTITEVSPPDIAVGSASLWVTVRGDGFLETESIVHTSAGEYWLTEYVSPTEVRAFVPDAALLVAGVRTIAVDSVRYPGRLSNRVSLPVRALPGSAGAATPSVRAMLPASVSPAPAQTGAARTVDLLGEGFAAGAQVLAEIDDQPAIALPTLSVSPHQLRAQLDPNAWAERWLEVAFIVTASPERAAVRVIKKLRPNVSVARAAADELPEATVLTPAVFADLSALNPDTGKPRDERTFWDRQTSGFYIRVDDPSLRGTAAESPRVEDPGTLAQVTLTSYDGTSDHAQQVDIIPNVRMRAAGAIASRTEPDAYLSGRFEGGQDSRRQIFVVTDEADDTTLSGGDNTSDDVTIRMAVTRGAGRGQVGGALGITYRNRRWPTNVEPMRMPAVEVCPATLKRYMTVKVFNLSSTGDSTVTAWMEQAREIWAQGCVEVDWTLEPLVDTAGNPINPADYRNLDDVTMPVLKEASLLPEERRLLTEAQMKTIRDGKIVTRTLSRQQDVLVRATRACAEGLPDRAGCLAERVKEIAVYIVDTLKDSPEVQGLAGLESDVGGRALTDRGFFQSRNPSDPTGGLLAWHLNYRLGRPTAWTLENQLGFGVVFLQAARQTLPFSGTVIPPANGKALAHEIGHLVFGPGHDNQPPPALMHGTRQDESSLLQKRLSADQVRRTIRPSESRPRFLQQR